MRSLWIRVPVLVCLLAVPGWSQQATPTQSSQSQTPAPRDPQAVSVLNQALAVAGGAAAFNAIADYTATGMIVSDQGQPSQDSVSISGRGANELRKDMTKSAGMSTSIINDVVTTTKDPRGRIEAHAIQPPMMSGNLVLPYREMAMVFSNPQFSLAYLGIVQIGTASVFDIRAQFAPGALHVYQTVDFFIDASTLQLHMIQDALPRRAIPRTISYSDFRTVSGVVAPFQITETIGGQPISTIQLNQITLNVGLQDSTFQADSTSQ